MRNYAVEVSGRQGVCCPCRTLPESAVYWGTLLIVAQYLRELMEDSGSIPVQAVLVILRVIP